MCMIISVAVVTRTLKKEYNKYVICVRHFTEAIWFDAKFIISHTCFCLLKRSFEFRYGIIICYYFSPYRYAMGPIVIYLSICSGARRSVNLEYIFSKVR